MEYKYPTEPCFLIDQAHTHPTNFDGGTFALAMPFTIATGAPSVQLRLGIQTFGMGGLRLMGVIMRRRKASVVVAKDKRKNYVRDNVLGFNDQVKMECRDFWREKGHTISKKSPVNHMTPLSAGGCPNSQKNLIPSGALSPECQAVDDAQTKLQEFGDKRW